MNKILPLLVVAAIAVCPVAAQQPNTPGVASLVFAGADGPPFPITVNWTSTVISMDLEGAPGLPYNVYSAGFNGQAGLFPGAATTPAGIVDLDILTGFQTLLEGFSPRTTFDRLSIMDPTGMAGWVFPIGSSGTVGAFQALVADPTTMIGATLTAASEVNVSLGQNLLITGGDDTTGQINLFFGSGVNFYGVPYSSVNISDNGHLTFGGADGDPFSSAAKFDVGFPRIAPLWTDFTNGATVGGQPLIGTFSETEDGFTFNWTLQVQYNVPGSKATLAATTSTFETRYFYTGTATANITGSAGAILFDYTTPQSAFAPPIPGNITATYGVMGITPGGTVPASPADPLTSTALDPAPVTFDPVTQAGSTPPISLAPAGAMTSYRAEYPTAGSFPGAALSGTGAQVWFYPLNAATGDNYVLY